jgi:hypothetical protein
MTKRIRYALGVLLAVNVLLVPISFGAVRQEVVIPGSGCPEDKPLRNCAALCTDGTMDCCTSNCSNDCVGCVVKD